MTTTYVQSRTEPWLSEEVLRVDGFALCYDLRPGRPVEEMTVLLPGGEKEDRRQPVDWLVGRKVVWPKVLRYRDGSNNAQKLAKRAAA